MERIIKINGWEVIKGLCTVGFNVRTSFGGTDLSSDVTGITHGTAYDILDSADEVIKDNEDSVTAIHGQVAIHIYKA